MTLGYFSHRLEYFENNFISRPNSLIKVPAHIDPNMGDLVAGATETEHLPQIRVGVFWSGAQNCNISETVQDRTKVTIYDGLIGIKSHTRFRLVLKSMTLDDLERPKRHSGKNEIVFFFGANQKYLNEDRHRLSPAKCRSIILVFTAQCTLVQSAVLRSHVVCLSVCLSVCPSVCDVGGSGSHRSEILETNCADT